MQLGQFVRSGVAHPLRDESAPHESAPHESAPHDTEAVPIGDALDASTDHQDGGTGATPELAAAPGELLDEHAG